MTNDQSNDQSGVGRRTFLKGVAAGMVGAGLGGSLAPDLQAEEEAAVEGLATRVLGRTNRSVTVVGFGAGRLQADNARLLPAAVERGINIIDTSWNYMGGQSELQIGEFLKTCPDREKLFLNTKASGFRPPEGTAKEVYEALEAKVLESLKRLQTDYVDGFMWPHGANSPEQVRNPVMQEAMLKLREKGLVRFFGLSTHSNARATCLAAIEDGFYDHLLVVINVCTQNLRDPEVEEVLQEGDPPPAEPPPGATPAGETPPPKEPRPPAPPAPPMRKNEEEKRGDAPPPPGRPPSGEEPPKPGEKPRPRRRRRRIAIADSQAVLAAAKEKNIGIMAMKVAQPMFLRKDADDLLAAAALAESVDLSRHQRLYTYGIRQEGVHTVLVGMRAVDHVREALAIGR